ncbi:hypothetical protein PIIN_08842 [Serendipita indica DSM 11827]|uniref:Uncharacterized protein n=1 Tax=Serendipita indica (strain DSM 11827) TaxID=1109443 RepID=G4TU79_SERID|nr:hypothetical protein PIIN_08842 [Serendipita indica DSM 11827]
MGRYRRRRYEEFLAPDAQALRGEEKTTSHLEDDPRLSIKPPRQYKGPLQQTTTAIPVETASSLIQQRKSVAPSSDEIRILGVSPVVTGRRGTVETGSQLPMDTPNVGSSVSEDAWDQGPPAYSPRRSPLYMEDWKPGRVPFDSANHQTRV